MLSNYQILLMRTSYYSVKSYCMTYYRPKRSPDPLEVYFAAGP